MRFNPSRFNADIVSRPYFDRQGCLLVCVSLCLTLGSVALETTKLVIHSKPYAELCVSTILMTSWLKDQLTTYRSEDDQLNVITELIMPRIPVTIACKTKLYNNTLDGLDQMAEIQQKTFGSAWSWMKMVFWLKLATCQYWFRYMCRIGTNQLPGPQTYATRRQVSMNKFQYEINGQSSK